MCRFRLLIALPLCTVVIGCSDPDPVSADASGSTGSDSGQATDTTQGGDDLSTDGEAETATPPPMTTAVDSTGPVATSTTSDSSDGTASGTDSDSNGTGVDNDEDGFSPPADCNDSDPDVYPGAIERCNGLDDDCDPATPDEHIVSVDGEGSWPTISDAVAAAPVGGELTICPGVYEEHVSIGQDLSLEALEGPMTTRVESDPSGPVIEITAGEVSIQGLTLTGGDSNGFGGGLSVLTAGPTAIEDCIITGNSSTDGAGIYATAGTELEIDDSFITGNAGEIGGGIAFYGDILTVNNSTIQANTATDTGGALFIADGGDAEFTMCSIVDNEAPAGGGFASVDAIVTTVDSVVQRNQGSPAAPTAGGGAWLFGDEGFIQSINSDWGTGATDNTPDDVLIVGVGAWTDFGAAANFSCEVDSGCL